MVSVAEAEKVILDHRFMPRAESVLLAHAHGRVLAEQIRADRDLPPVDRATMDGIALAAEHFKKGQREFAIEGIQAAGQPQLALTSQENCYEVMTGASLPLGTDQVIPYEAIAIENKIAKIGGEVGKGMNVHARGSDARKGEILMQPGFKISPAEIALLASVGKSKVNVYKTPLAAVIATGDELVEVNHLPLPHQIRKSNSYALAAALDELGCKVECFHLIDDTAVLKEKIREILETYELVILSGGVSKGKFDFVPPVLESLGVKKLFHQISQRPGKPMWFGQSGKNTVFALPGNPVSTFMCFYRYVKPWLMAGLGCALKNQSAILATDFTFSPPLSYFLQVKTQNENGRLMAYPIGGGGSGDFANLKEVDGFLELPLEENDFKRGNVFPFHPFR